MGIDYTCNLVPFTFRGARITCANRGAGTDNCVRVWDLRKLTNAKGKASPLAELTYSKSSQARGILAVGLRHRRPASSHLPLALSVPNFV